MITAAEATKLRNDTKNPNSLAIVRAILNWEHECYVCLGSNLTAEEIIQAKQKYLNAGYDIVDEQSYRTFDGITPIDTKPVITRIKISWKEN